MANPQLENGYTRLANEIIEEVARRKFNGTQYSILMIVWRYTYGFGRKEHELGAGFIAEATGTSKKVIQREINKLIEEKVLTVTKEATANSSRVIAFNKNYVDWQIESRGLKSTQGTKQEPGDQLGDRGLNSTHPGDQLVDWGGDQLVDWGGDQLVAQERKERKKENIKEIKEEEEKEEKGPAAVFKFFEQNGGLLSPYTADLIGEWLDDPFFNDPSGSVMAAMKETVKQGVHITKWKYTEAILNDWKTKGLKTLEQINEHIRTRGEQIENAQHSRHNGRTTKAGRTNGGASEPQPGTRKFIKTV